MKCFSLVFMLFAFDFIHAAPRPLALESLEPDRAMLVMGGSFSPPTEAHLAAMADLLYEQEFPHGIFLVAKPYKAGAAPAAVSMALTRIAVESFDYVLRRRNIPYRDFKVLGPGRATWTSKAGRSVLLEMSSFDNDHDVSESITSIRHFSGVVGSRNLWWLAGGDSAASMPKWGPWWPEMFDLANMIFIGRKSDPGELSVDHTEDDPLRGIYPAEFLAAHAYELRNGRVHVYRAKTEGKPSVFVLGKSTLPYSSTLARKSLQTEEQEAAQLMLVPAVYRAIVENGFYASARNLLTRENLERYLLEEFRLVQEGRGDVTRYRSFLAALVTEMGSERSSSLPRRTPAVRSNLPPLGTELSPALADLRNQLVLGDPRFLVSRVRLTNEMGLEPSSRVVLNLVKSRMPFSVPLNERQAVDRRTRWYDLNISMNEMRATLANPSLVRALEEASRGEQGALANALVTAVQLEPAARRRFEIFTSRRYFNRLALGLVRSEFLDELEPEERAFEEWAERTLAALAVHLSPSQVILLGQILGDLYIYRRHSGARDDAFWTEFLDLALTDYPGEALDLTRTKTLEALARRLTMMNRALTLLGDEPPPKIVYRGTVMADVDAGEFRLRGPLARWDGTFLAPTHAEGISNLRVMSGLKRYLKDLARTDHRPFAAHQPRGESFDFLPLPSSRSTVAQNLVRDIHFFYTDVSRDLEAIRETFEGIIAPPSTELVRARNAALRDLSILKTRLEALESEWLRQKQAYPFERNDADVPDHARVVATYRRLQTEFGLAVDRARAVNHVALGMVSTLEEAENLTPTSPVTRATARELLWRDIVGDLLDKYMQGNPEGPLGRDRLYVVGRLSRLDLTDLVSRKLGDVLTRLMAALDPRRPAAEHAESARQVLAWLNQKYGLLDEVILRPMDREVEGSYRAHALARYTWARPTLHPLFDARAVSAMPDVSAYVHRKWGGLRRIARPSRVVFSELGTEDTLAALRARGFDQFYQVNASYAMRGSKTMMAFGPDRSDPLVIFHSFIGEDLFQHKLMQLAVDFGDDFSLVSQVSSNEVKSWDRAREVVAKAVADLEDFAADDLVLGYGETIAKTLRESRYAKLVRTERLGDFADLLWFTVVGKNDLERRVLVVSNIAYRYFGKSVLPLVRPFLERGVERVIFAGSAGGLDARVPIHGIVVPRSFRILEDDGIARHVAVANDLYAHAPYGVVHSGPHLSVPSPLIESRARVGLWREKLKIVSVDVEGAQIARLIDEHNANPHARPVRFASAYIVTDRPSGGPDNAGEPGLHRPDFAYKTNAKNLYGNLLRMLWDVPTRMGFSTHTAMVARHFSGRVNALVRERNGEGLARLRRELRGRLQTTAALHETGGRVSRGLTRVLGDLVARIDRSGLVGAENWELPVAPIAAVSVRRSALEEGLERAVMLQSLSRSSTINSGDTVYNRVGGEAKMARDRAARAAERAVDWVLDRRHRALGHDDALELNRLVNRDVLNPKYQAGFAPFHHVDESGRATSSLELVRRFFDILQATPPSFEAGIRAFVDYEAIHPHVDGTGRTAELIAQHTMLRAGHGPVLMPNRFDIDFVLSLSRNGGAPGNSTSYVSSLAETTARFTEALESATRGREITGSRLDPSTGEVVVTFGDGTSLWIQSLHVAKMPIELEREQRTFVRDETVPTDRPNVRFARENYDVVYLFGDAPWGCEGNLTETRRP